MVEEIAAGTSCGSNCSRKQVALNVGGHRFTTTIQTLQREPEGMLARLVSEDWMGKKDEDDKEPKEIFIDRNGLHFHWILDYLRHGPSGAYIPENVDVLNELLREAEFYQLTGLLELIKTKLHLPNRMFKSGEIVRWREDAIEYYWRPFAVVIVHSGVEYPFHFDKVGRKYNDKQTNATCIGCSRGFTLDQVTVFDYKVPFEEWEGLKHHMRFMRGIVAETVDETCCVVQWNNGTRLHVPVTAVMPAE